MIVQQIISWVLAVPTALLAVPAVVLFLQTSAAVLLRPRTFPDTGDHAETRAPRIAVLMPAHNEAAGIDAAIAAVIPQLGTDDRLVVIADNCVDATAAIARSLGAQVVERSDAEHRGKGYALDFGVRSLESDPPDIVVIVDADCILGPEALVRLARRCTASARPVQALYLMRSPPEASSRMRVAEFAWAVKNQVRPLGGAALGWPCQLMGTGMAFTWPMIRGAPLASGHLVEDMQLGLDLAAAGTPPLFGPEALVSSVFPSDEGATRSQRTRWEHGHLSVIASVGPRTLWRSLMRRDARLAAMTLDLMVPPLASLVLASVALLVVNAVWWAAGGALLPLVLSITAMGLLTFAVWAAWRRFGGAIIGAKDLLSLPMYVLAKIPVYVRLFTKRQVEWVRTRRDDRGP